MRSPSKISPKFSAPATITTKQHTDDIKLLMLMMMMMMMMMTMMMMMMMMMTMMMMMMMMTMTRKHPPFGNFLNQRRVGDVFPKHLWISRFQLHHCLRILSWSNSANIQTLQGGKLGTRF